MSNQLIIRFNEEDVMWLTDKTYKVKQIGNGCYTMPFYFENDLSVISSCGYKYPHLFKGGYLLSGILNRCLDLIVWDAEDDQINIAATGFTITVDLPTTHQNILEKKWWRRIGMGEATLKKTLIILEKLNYLSLSKTKSKPGYTQISLNISKCNQSLKAGQLELDRWEVENESNC